MNAQDYATEWRWRSSASQLTPSVALVAPFTAVYFVAFYVGSLYLYPTTLTVPLICVCIVVELQPLLLNFIRLIMWSVAYNKYDTLPYRPNLGLFWLYGYSLVNRRRFFVQILGASPCRSKLF